MPFDLPVFPAFLLKADLTLTRKLRKILLLLLNGGRTVVATVDYIEQQEGSLNFVYRICFSIEDKASKRKMRCATWKCFSSTVQQLLRPVDQKFAQQADTVCYLFTVFLSTEWSTVALSLLLSHQLSSMTSSRCLTVVANLLVDWLSARDITPVSLSWHKLVPCLLVETSKRAEERAELSWASDDK